MTYLRADQETSQLSLETSKAAECYRYPLIKAQLCLTICLGGTSHRRQWEGEMQPPQGCLSTGGPCCHPAPALWPLEPLQVEGSQDNPAPARGHILPTAPAGAQDAQPAPTPAEELGCSSYGNRKQKKWLFLPRGAWCWNTQGGCEHWAPSLCRAPGKVTAGCRVMLGFGGWDKRCRTGGAARQSSVLTEHISCLSQNSQPSLH